MNCILALLTASALQSELPEDRRMELPISLSGEVLRIASQGPPPREEGLVLNVGVHARYTIPF